MKPTKRTHTLPVILTLSALGLTWWLASDRPGRNPITRDGAVPPVAETPHPPASKIPEEALKREKPAPAPADELAAGTTPPPALLPAHVLRSREIALHSKDLPTEASPAGSEMPLMLFADAPVTVEWFALDVHGSENFAWHGRLAEDPASGVTLTRYEDHSIIDVQSPLFGQYEIRGQDGHPGELREFDSTLINRGCPGGVEVAGFGDAPPSELETSTSEEPEIAFAEPFTIDVLMVYTTKAREKSGSTRSGIVSKAQAAVNNQNGTFNRSNIDHRVRLVQTREVGRTASGNLSTELNWVAGNSTVAGYRNTAGADIVAYLPDRDDENMFGIAQQLGSTSGNSGVAFSANYYDTASGVWPHEMGHNLGCQHNSSGVYPYSSGHYWNDSGTTRGSIMSYIGTRIGYFSNPSVNYSGHATGTSSRDNARSINNIGDNVAGYRASKTLIEPSCSLISSTKNPLEETNFKLTVTSKNGGPATFNSGKVNITLPSRLTLVSHNGGSSFDSATNVWTLPSLGSGASAKLELTVRANSGSVGITLTPKAVLSPIGSSFVDFNVYNNEGTVAIVPYAVAPEETAVTYREVFNNGTGAAINFPALGWKHLMSATPTVVDGTGADPALGGNHGQADQSAATANGFAFAGGSRTGLLYTDEYTGDVPLNIVTLRHISFMQSLGDVRIGLHVALRFGTGTGAVWYYADKFASEAINNMAGGEIFEINDFTTSDWSTSINSTGTDAQYDQALPSDDITAFGIYVTKPSGTNVSARFDNFEIEASLEPPATPFANWMAENYPQIPEDQRSPDDDPDNDGATNLLEFALSSSPSDASSTGLMISSVGDSDPPGSKELTLTISVRAGATFIDGSASIDGITYTVEGSRDLEFPGAQVSSTDPSALAPVGSGLPDLTGTGWEYHTFKLEPPVDPEEPESADTGSGNGFLRLKVTEP